MNCGKHGNKDENEDNSMNPTTLLYYKESKDYGV